MRVVLRTTPSSACAEQHVAPVPALERRPDRVVPAVRALVAAQLGQEFTEAPPLDLGACLADSAPARPLIFILSPGADPMAALAQLAAEQVGAAAAMRFVPCHVCGRR